MSGQEEKENSVLITAFGGVHLVRITILCQLSLSKYIFGLNNKEIAKLLLNSVKEENVKRKGQ